MPNRIRPTYWTTTLACFGISLLGYLALRQRTLHGYDVFQLLRWLQEPELVHPRHPGYLPLVRALHWGLSPLQPSAMFTLQLASCLGGSLAVAIAHRAALQLRPEPALAAFVAATCGACMGWAYFATEVEFHAVFLPFAIASLWAIAAYRRSGRWLPLVTAFALSGLAAVVHGTGHILVFVMAAMVLAEDRRLTPKLLLAVPVHVAVWGGLYVWLRSHGTLITSADTVDFVTGRLDLPSILADLPRIALREYLLPFLPASLLLPLLLLSKRWRWWAALTLGLASGYVLFSAWMLRDGSVEHGAYVLPLAFPMVVLLGMALTPRGRFVMWVGTLVWSLLYVWVPGLCTERLPRDDALGAAILELQRQQPTRVMVGNFVEYDSVLALDPLADCRNILIDCEPLRGGADPSAAAIAGWLQWQVAMAAAKGERFVVTDGAVGFLRAMLPQFEAAWRDEQALPRQRVGGGEVAGYDLRPPN